MCQRHGFSFTIVALTRAVWDQVRRWAIRCCGSLLLFHHQTESLLRCNLLEPLGELALVAQVQVFQGKRLQLMQHPLPIPHIRERFKGHGHLRRWSHDRRQRWCGPAAVGTAEDLAVPKQGIQEVRLRTSEALRRWSWNQRRSDDRALGGGGLLIAGGHGACTVWCE